MTSFEEKIREYGQKRDIEGLQEYITSLSVDELLNVVKTRLNNTQFPYTWNYILQGFTETSESHNKRFELAVNTLKEVEISVVSSTECNNIIRRFCIELEKFRTEHLLKLCDFCIECLQSQKVSSMSWKELLPELLNVIRKKERVECDGEEMSGVDYKHQIINTICSLQWFPSTVIALTEMFIDLSLSKEEHLQVVNKLVKQFEKMTPQEIPAFVYQLLRLCKNSNSRLVFFKLQHYLGLRYYNKLRDETRTNSDSMEMDLIGDPSTQDILEAEATVLYHIHSLASLGQNFTKDYLNFLKTILRSPEFILHPFQLSVLLTLSTIPHHEEKIFEILRSCVSRAYNEDQKKTSSAWFRDTVSVQTKLEDTFVYIISASAQDREFVVQGLVNFGFVLLGVGSQLGRDLIAEKQWQLGSIILFKVLKIKRNTTSIIMENLSNRILTEQTVTQYIECLYLMSRSLAILMLENKSIIVLLMEGLMQMQLNNAIQLLDALIPIAKVSPTIKDHLILLLKKALYSRSNETKQVAVTGFLKLLTNFKIVQLTLSQPTFSGSFSSGHSLFTQISMNSSSQCTPNAFSNEALCLEVLGILKRCFMQQAEVRIQLYTGLYDAVCLNSELGFPVLDLLWFHFRDFYNIDEETAVPLKFEKITLTRDVHVSLQEPLGKFIYTIGLVVTKAAQDDAANSSVVRFIDILESVCKRMINCDLIHFELDDGTDLSDVIPEAQHKLFVLKEAMSVYEALIGYKFHSWELDSENNGKQVNDLFQGYLRLLQCLKNVYKPKKGDKKKKDPNKTTQQTTTNTTLKKDGQKSSSLKSLKLPNTVLDFQVLSKIISFLHEPMVSWTTVAQANIVKSKRQFHQHIMQALLNLLTSIKNKKIIETRNAKSVYGHLCDIAKVIYDRIIKRMLEFIDFDCTTGVLAAEAFLLILNIVNNHYKSNFKAFLSRVGGQDTGEHLIKHLTEFVQTYQKLFEADEDEISQDPEVKKLSVIVVNTLSFLAHQIPSNNNPLALQMMGWIKDYAISNELKSKQVTSAFTTLLFDCHIKFKVSLTFFEKISVRIGDVTGVVNEEEHTVEEIKLINEQTVNNVFTALCHCIKSILEDTDWIIARLKADFILINYPSDEGLPKRQEKLKTRERGVCCHLCFVVTILTHLSNCTIPTGTLSEVLLKNLSLLFSTLSSLTKYFTLRSSKINPVFQGARFDRLVKLAGKQLAPAVYRLIMYIEESQKQETVSPKKSKKKVDPKALKNKVLKETRFIPKVVYEIEQFSKFILQLSKKTKIDLSKYMGQGTARDFRILHLKEVLEEVNNGAPVQTQESDTSVIEEEKSDEETSPPPSKRRNIETSD